VRRKRPVQPRFFWKYRDFVTVRGWPIVEIDHVLHVLFVMTFGGEALITAPSGLHDVIQSGLQTKELLVHRGQIIPVERDHLHARLTAPDHLERADLNALDNGCGDGSYEPLSPKSSRNAKPRDGVAADTDCTLPTLSGRRFLKQCFDQRAIRS
jgi:hypothetical protein